MKSILILIVNILFLAYTVMFFADHRFWPEENSQKGRNMILIIVTAYVCYNILYIYILKKDVPENGLIYKIASTAQYIFLNATAYIQPFQKELITWSLVALGLIVVGFLLVGMPGALLMETPVWLGICKPIEGDNAWPAALFLSFLWPLLLPAAVIMKHSLIRYGHIAYAGYGLMTAFVLAGIVFLTALAFLIFRK